MTYFNFDTPATASWSDHVLFGDVHNGIGKSRHFDRLRDALAFVTEELPEDLRGNIWVMTESQTYNKDEIAELKAKLAATSP